MSTSKGSRTQRQNQLNSRHFTFVGCGNRHCPACGGTRSEQWLRKHCALLLPDVVYHLITFTVPEGLRRAIRSHPRELLELLMRLSSDTLLDVCANGKWLGAAPGLSALLHTWTRQHAYHPHVHFIGTGGGLTERGQWVDAHPKFLVPVHALSSVFRARFRDALREQHPDIFAAISSKVWKEKQWVVHSKPVGTGQNTLAYLARYVYRVALSERDILQHDSNRITVRYRKSGTHVPRTMRLEPQEFIRRFLQHVLPSGFRKIRYFGLHHSSKRPVLRSLQAAMSIRAGRRTVQWVVRNRSELIHDRKPDLRLKILSRNWAVLNIAAVQFSAGLCNQLDVASEVTPVDQGESRGSVSSIKFSLRQSRGSRIGCRDAEVLCNEVVGPERREEEYLSSCAVELVAESVSCGKDAEPSEIAFSTHGSCRHPVSPVLSNRTADLKKPNQMGVPFLKPFESAFFGIVRLESVFVSHPCLDEPYIRETATPTKFHSFPKQQMVAVPPLYRAGGFHFEFVFIGTVVGGFVFDADPEGDTPAASTGEVKDRGKRHKRQLALFLRGGMAGDE